MCCSRGSQVVETDLAPERCFPKQREHKETISISRARWAACLTAYLRALHSQRTETRSKEQGKRKRHQGVTAHSFTITSKMGVEGSACLFCKISAWKQRGKRGLNPDSWKAQQDSLQGTALQKKSFSWSASPRTESQKGFLKAIHEEAMSRLQVSQPRKRSWASLQATQSSCRKPYNLLRILKDVIYKL